MNDLHTLWFAESHMFLWTARRTVRVNSVVFVCSLSLCMGAKLCPSGCQMCHYFAGPLHRDVGYLLDSAPQHHIAHRTRRRRGRKLELLSSWPMPGGRALWASSRGVAPQTLGVGKGIQKEIQKRTASFLDVMPSSHTPLDHGGKQATKKRISKRRFLLAPYVRCQILVDSCSVAGFFCCSCCGSHKIMAAEMLLVCGEDANRSGQLELEYSWKPSFTLWNLGRHFPPFLFAVLVYI